MIRLQKATNNHYRIEEDLINQMPINKDESLHFVCIANENETSYFAHEQIAMEQFKKENNLISLQPKKTPKKEVKEYLKSIGVRLKFSTII